MASEGVLDDGIRADRSAIAAAAIRPRCLRQPRL